MISILHYHSIPGQALSLSVAASIQIILLCTSWVSTLEGRNFKLGLIKRQWVLTWDTAAAYNYIILGHYNIIIIIFVEWVSHPPPGWKGAPAQNWPLCHYCAFANNVMVTTCDREICYIHTKWMLYIPLYPFHVLPALFILELRSCSVAGSVFT